MWIDTKQIAASYRLSPAVAGDIVAQCLQQSMRRRWPCWAVLLGGALVTGCGLMHGHGFGLWPMILSFQSWVMLAMHYARAPIHAAALAKAAESRRTVDALAGLLPGA